MGPAPRLLVTGASGHLGSYLRAELETLRSAACSSAANAPGQAFGEVIYWRGPHGKRPPQFPGQHVDFRDVEQVERQFEQAAPKVIIHAAAMSRVDQCYANKEEAHQVNAVATSQLADLAERHEARLVMVSTDLVFDGSSPPYAEEAAACPRSHYGTTKLLGEQAVLSHRQGLVARVSLLFGPARNGRRTFFDQQREALQRREPCRLFADEWRTPLSLSMAARVLRQLALSNKTGLVHVGGPERMSRLEMGERLAKFLGLSTEAIVPIHQKELVTPEPRPSDVSLDSRRLRSWLPELSWLTFDESLAELCEVRGDSDYPATDRGPTRWK